MAETPTSDYPGRRIAANHDYIHNLNVVPSPPRQQQQGELFDMDKELSLFTNAEFMDFETGVNVNHVQQNLKFDATAIPPTTAAHNQPPSNETARHPPASATNEQALYDFFNGTGMCRYDIFSQSPSTQSTHPYYCGRYTKQG